MLEANLNIWELENDNQELMSLVNDLVGEGYLTSDNLIHENDQDFFETYYPDRPYEAALAVSFGDYRPSDEYVTFNGYANLESSSYVSDLIPIADIEDAYENWLYDNGYEEDEEEE